jgi:hypothetical protein
MLEEKLADVNLRSSKRKYFEDDMDEKLVNESLEME